MIEELNTLEKDVEAILLNDPFTRADDMLLYWLDGEKEAEE